MKDINIFLKESLSKSEENDLLEYTEKVILNIISECDLQIEIKELWFHGSRARGDNRPDSDYDIVLYYEGNEREDDVFNIMHDQDYEDQLKWNDCDIDINPIRDQETGSLKKYKEKDKKYKK